MKFSLGFLKNKTTLHIHDWIHDDSINYRTCCECGMRQRGYGSMWYTIRKDWVTYGEPNSKALVVLQMLGAIIKSREGLVEGIKRGRKAEWILYLEHPEFLKNADAMEHPEKYLKVREDDDGHQAVETTEGS